MSENLDAMIDAVINKTPGEFKAALSAEMQSRASELIQDYRQEVAKTMFQPPEAEEEVEDQDVEVEAADDDETPPAVEEPTD